TFEFRKVLELARSCPGTGARGGAGAKRRLGQIGDEQISGALVGRQRYASGTVLGRRVECGERGRTEIVVEQRRGRSTEVDQLVDSCLGRRKNHAAYGTNGNIPQGRTPG